MFLSEIQVLRRRGLSAVGAVRSARAGFSAGRCLPRPAAPRAGGAAPSREEAARACGAVRWTLRQAQRSACGGVQLARDLLVLGVPRAHAAALAEAADGTRAAYEASVRANGFMINKVSEVSASPAPEGSINAVQLTITSNEVFAGEQNTDQLLIDRSQVNNLLQQLKTAYQKMEDIDFE
ncbi:unnamed protein product [Leptidea sinapis]|uniref:COMM domain-containing protein n=1 Tax=Leptidea sinapis TaxID=189913 RepID=A0A5E4Q9P7_9NEOP|nr:unnamed protein product [Leptidea sinapis]